MNVLILVPAHNEAVSIGSLVRSVKQMGFAVLVVDDGSGDGTASIAAEAGSEVISRKVNSGKGAALAEGFAYALRQGVDAVITMDGDGQHQPSDIQGLLLRQEATQCGMVIGNRMANPTGMPWIRVLTNRGMSFFLSLVVGQWIPDTQCGMRLITRKLLERCELNTRKFEIESEMILKAARCGVRIESVPIKSVYGDEKSRIDPWQDTLRFFRFVFKETFARGKAR
jgi:glycosyltransferase involved in cell wall biosynthesis